MSSVRLAAVRSEPLQLAEVLAAVADPAAGGFGIFVGAVRTEDGGRPVSLLEYTAHPTAEQELRRVAEEVATDPAVIALAAVHRTGTLAVGDLAVIVAVAAVHRGEALDAARRLIDEVKSTVPIWKRQVFADGTQEWVGTP